MRDGDYTASVDFLRTFFAGTEDDVEIRVIDSNGGRVIRLFGCDAEKIKAFCAIHDVDGKAVYFGCATRLQGSASGGRENLSEIVCLLIDIDCEERGLSVDEVIDALKGCPCRPSITVRSGRGVHAYWLLREPLNVTAWTPDQDAAHSGLMRRLAECFAGDINCCDLPRIMRLPGTHNSKYGGWRLCEVAAANEDRYEVGDLAEMLDLLKGRRLIIAPDEEKEAGVGDGDAFLTYGQASPGMDVEAELAAMRLGGGKQGVHWTRLRASAHWVRKGKPDSEIHARLLAETQRAYVEAGKPWTTRRERLESDRLLDEIAGAHRRGYAPAPDTKVVQLRPGHSEKPDLLPETDHAPEFMGFPLNDLGNAYRLIKMHAPSEAASKLTYVIGLGWHIWDGTRYRRDPESLAGKMLADDTAREMMRQAQSIRPVPEETPAQKKRRTDILKFAAGSGNSARLKAMLEEAKKYRKAESDDFDRQPLLLNCPNGTVDLATGALTPHKQTDRLSKLAGAVYDPDSRCPIWDQFLIDIFAGNQEIIDFVQRMMGYTLTGETKEEVVLILFGLGANGKSVMIETLARVMGEYAKHSAASTWMVKQNDGGPRNDVAGLAGARFVSVVETEHGKQLAEALLKQASSGDIMRVRFLYEEDFEFTPRFKLWLATNHKPRIQGDYAIWRRLLLLPFDVTFADADKRTSGQKLKDPDLKEKLIAEYPGILAWMIRGAMAWQSQRLCPPKAVLAATAAYEISQNSVAGFISDNCGVQKSSECEGQLMLTSYELWCEENDIPEPLSDKAFYARLTEMGYPSKRRNNIRYRQGLDLTQPARQAADDEKAARAAKKSASSTNGE